MKYIELSTLRFFAIILIVNSHLENFYSYKYLATGGAIGNAIFFFISGVGLTLSFKQNKLNFWLWLKKRYLRIYPKMIFIVLLLIFLDYSQVASLYEFIIKIIFPKEFWFLPVLSYFYILLYYVIKKYETINFKILIFGIIIIYLICYFNFLDRTKYSIETYIYFKSIFYFLIIIIGIFFGNNYNLIFFNFKKTFIILIINILSLYLLKFLSLKYNYYYFQFLEHVFIFNIVISLFQFMKNDKVYNILNLKLVKSGILFISSLSLEIYLIHIFFINIPIGKFPINILIFIFIVLILSLFFRKIFKYLRLS